MKMLFKFSVAAVGAASVLAVAAPASAATIMGLYNTGVNNAGVVQAAGAVDTHYTITASTSPALVIPANAFTTIGNVSWAANAPVGSTGPSASSWLTPNVAANGRPLGVACPNPGPCSYDYSINFNLGTLNPATALITGELAADNYAIIYLNGVAVANQAHVAVAPPGLADYFRNFRAFSINGSDNFVNGINTLTFRVTDVRPFVVTGLNVRNLVGNAVPEPATWAMMLTGFGLVASQLRRRRRAGSFVTA